MDGRGQGVLGKAKRILAKRKAFWHCNDGMLGPSIETAGANPDQLISAPHVALQLLELCQDFTNVEDLRGVVLQDSGLCARILDTAVKTCPEALNPETPLSSALVGLGKSALRTLALKASKTLIDAPLNGHQTQFFREMWFYAQVNGALCRSLAEAAGYPAVEEAQLTGLMLNVGTLALFSNNPRIYVEQIGHTLGSPQVCNIEQSYFASNHCQLGASLVTTWQIDSFMAEALRFMHVDPLACREAALLVRIARLAFELSKTPLGLNADNETLAAQLLGLDTDVLREIFHRTVDYYRLLAPPDKNPDACRQDLDRTRQKLTSIVFSLAEQDGIHALMTAGGDDRAAAATAARSLYLRMTPAKEVIIFAAAGDGKRFVGQPVSGQARRLGQLSSPIDGANLLADALRSASLKHTFEHNDQTLSLFDHQLLRLCGTSGFAVVPLHNDHRRQGAIVLGLDSVRDLHSLNDSSCRQLGRAAAAGLDACPISAVDESAVSRDGRIHKIAHELRTPLAIISNYLCALGPLLEGHANFEGIGAIESEVRRIGEILTYYTETDLPAVENKTPRLCLEDLVVSVLDSLSATHFAPKHIHVVTDLEKNPEPLPVSSVAIRQILLNLLKNAAEALGENGRIDVTAGQYRTSDAGRQMVIGIQDNGPGIDETVYENLFSPVVSTKGQGHAGLGLHIVKGLADDIGAHIVCQSRAGKGTRFELIIEMPDHETEVSS